MAQSCLYGFSKLRLFYHFLWLFALSILIVFGSKLIAS